jgi:hypothetical protein
MHRQFRGSLLARLLPTDDVELGPQFEMPPEYYSTSTITTAAPSYVVNSLPVYAFKPRKGSKRHKQQQQVQEAGQDLQTCSKQQLAAGSEGYQQQQQGDSIQLSFEGICSHHRTTSNCSDASSSSGSLATGSTTDSCIRPGDSSRNSLGTDGSISSSSLEQLSGSSSSLCNDDSNSSSGGRAAWTTGKQQLQKFHLHAGGANLQPQAAGTFGGSVPDSPPGNAALGASSGFETIRPAVGWQGHEGMQQHMGTSPGGDAANSSSSSYAASSSGSSSAGSSCGSAVQDGALSCVICFADYARGELIKRLPCQVSSGGGWKECTWTSLVATAVHGMVLRSRYT